MIVMSCIVIDDFAIASRYVYLIYDLSRDFYLPIYLPVIFSPNKYNSWIPSNIRKHLQNVINTSFHESIRISPCEPLI